MPLAMTIRPATANDWTQLWPMLQATFASGDTYPFEPDTPEDVVHHAWMEAPLATHVAVDEQGQLLGTYYLKANQVGLGSHVCNCGYVVSEHARHRGVATALCEHSQDLARALGFRAMQFNLVVSTNVRAVRLWQHLGFEQVGHLPGAFRHLTLGEVDALVLYKRLHP